MSMPVCRRLEGRVAVVTGGGGGIGLATVRRFAAEGASVVVADIDPNAASSAADDVGGLAVTADVSSSADVERLFRVADETYGRIDITFNNAGVSPPEDGSILKTGIDAWRRVQDVNLTSVYHCCRAVIPYMQRAGKGSIINTASFVAVLGSATSRDLVHGLEGRGASHVPRARRAIRQRGHQGQRPLPRPRKYALIAGALCQGPRTSGTATGARPGRSLRRA